MTHDYTELMLKTVRLTKAVREQRVISLRIRATKMKLSWLQEQILNDLERAVARNNNHAIDEMLEIAEEEICTV